MQDDFGKSSIFDTFIKFKISNVTPSIALEESLTGWQLMLIRVWSRFGEVD